jgi:replication factor A3
MEAVSTPRISADMVDSYVGQNVIVVGKVMQLRGDSAILDANGQVNAILNRVWFRRWCLTNYVANMRIP